MADDSSEIQTELLRVHVGLETVGKSLLLACRDLDGVLLGGEIANNTRAGRVEVRSPQTASHKLDGDGFGLLVAEGDDGIRGLSIDQLDAEDLSFGEGSGHSDIQVGRGCRSFV